MTFPFLFDFRFFFDYVIHSFVLLSIVFISSFAAAAADIVAGGVVVFRFVSAIVPARFRLTFNGWMISLEWNVSSIVVGLVVVAHLRRKLILTG